MHLASQDITLLIMQRTNNKGTDQIVPMLRLASAFVSMQKSQVCETYLTLRWIIFLQKFSLLTSFVCQVVIR